MKLQTAVVGATGYAGMELTRLLLRHSRVEAPILFRREGARGTVDGEMFPMADESGSPAIETFSIERMKQKRVGVVFLATPHGFSRTIVPQLLEQGMRVIDLSGAWRLREAKHRAV